MTFVEGPQSIEEIEKIPRLISAPQLINMVVGGVTPLLTLDELKNMRYAVILYANAALQAAIRGMQTVLTHLYNHGSVAHIIEEMASFKERQRLVSKHVYDELERKYRSKEDE